ATRICPKRPRFEFAAVDIKRLGSAAGDGRPGARPLIHRPLAGPAARREGGMMIRFSWTRKRRRALALIAPLTLVAGLLILAGGGASPASSAAVKMTKQQRRTLSGFLRFEL